MAVDSKVQHQRSSEYLFAPTQAKAVREFCGELFDPDGWRISMTDDCEHCGALWNHHALSISRPICTTCDERVCSLCDEVECSACGHTLHEECAVYAGEDPYCTRCIPQAIQSELENLPVDGLKRISQLCALDGTEFLRHATLEELLAASLLIAKMRGEEK